MKTKFTFSYGKQGLLLSFIPVIIWCLALPLVLLLTKYFLAVLLLFVTSGEIVPFRNWMDLIGLFVAFSFMGLIPHLLLNQINEIEVVEDGLRIRVFTAVFRWRFIPWNEIIGIEYSIFLDRWGQSLWVVKVKELTFWHTLLSQFFKTGKGAGILVSSDMNDRERLRELILENQTRYN